MFAPVRKSSVRSSPNFPIHTICPEDVEAPVKPAMLCTLIVVPVDTTSSVKDVTGLSLVKSAIEVNMVLGKKFHAFVEIALSNRGASSTSSTILLG